MIHCSRDVIASVGVGRGGVKEKCARFKFDSIGADQSVRDIAPEL
jgi:hypothetical protein